MKKLALSIVALALLGARPAVAQEMKMEMAEGQDVELTAHVVDLSCKIAYGLSGEEHRMCSQVCADNGVPLGLLADGKLYMPVSKAMPGGGANEQLKPLAEQEVKVKGKVIERGGLNTIIIDYLKSPEHRKILADNPGVTVETRTEKDLSNIKGSEVHLKKIIMNLVANAAEAQPLGGKIIISSESRYLDHHIKGYDDVDEGEYVVLRVEDFGEGILEGDLYRIFEPFYTKKVMGHSGTGLGMAVVWGTVQDHQGYIDVQSEVGQGTVFEIYFPLTRDQVVVAAEETTIDRYKGAGESILVIDDVADQRAIASHILKKLGYQVKKADSGEAAVDYLAQNSVDLILLDMIMEPGIDGLETYRRILAIHPGQKAIIASGFSETVRVKEALQSGAGAYIKKPYTIEKIAVAIRNELDKSSLA